MSDENRPLFKSDEYYVAFGKRAELHERAKAHLSLLSMQIDQLLRNPSAVGSAWSQKMQSELASAVTLLNEAGTYALTLNRLVTGLKE